MSEERFVGHKLNQSPLSRAEADLLAHEPEPAAKAPAVHDAAENSAPTKQRARTPQPKPTPPSPFSPTVAIL